MPTDQSILKQRLSQSGSYLDDLAFAVCVNGESLEKYRKIVEKQFGSETYANMEQFAKALQQQVNRKQFTKTSLLSLKYAGKNAGMSEDAIDMIIDYFNGKVKEDTAFWQQCSPNDKVQLKEYLRKFPSGIYASRAATLIADLERIEKFAIEESRLFNQCYTLRDYMNYLSRYPNGAYSSKAKSIIEEIKRKKIEESRSYNLCKDKRDYLEYLKKYPNGQYAKEAQAKITVFTEAETRDREETELWGRCRPDDRHCLQVYLNKYPDGKHAIQARSYIANLDKQEKEAIEENQLYNRCRIKADYLNYLRKYPNGRYAKEAQAKITVFTEAETHEQEEAELWGRCRPDDRHCLQVYLNKYPDGKHAVQARSYIANLDKQEKETAMQSMSSAQSNKKEGKTIEPDNQLDWLCWVVGFASALVGFISGGIGAAVGCALGGFFGCAFILGIIEGINES